MLSKSRILGLVAGFVVGSLFMAPAQARIVKPFKITGPRIVEPVPLNLEPIDHVRNVTVSNEFRYVSIGSEFRDCLSPASTPSG